MDKALVSVCLGIGLAAACGFRIFLPFLVMSLAAKAGYLTLTGSFAWIGSTPALIVFAVATGLEIAAYYIPWLDHFLDTLAAPVAIAAGVIATASVATGMDPMLKWSLAVIAGGGAAGAMHGLTSVLRGASTLATGGLANFLVATGEALVSFLLSATAIVLGPIVVVVAAVLGLWLLVRWLRGRRQPAGPAPA
ncbi:MAG: DUF4126 domain-containing protein [Thermoanaerobaculia bacterium]